MFGKRFENEEEERVGMPVSVLIGEVRRQKEKAKKSETKDVHEKNSYIATSLLVNCKG